MVPIIFVAVLTATTLPTYGLDAANSNVWNGVIYAPTPRSVGADIAHRDRLAALRKDALDQQARDGGTLTIEHRAELQRRLDAIEVRYAELRRRFDPFSVDANGHALYSAGNRPRIVLPPGITAQPLSK